MRNRVIYGLLTVGVVVAGLASRSLLVHSLFVKNYVGDALWALMVFLGLGFIFRRWPTKWVAWVALFFCFSIELSQLYHAPWIDSLRATRLGGLVLGFSFIWSDLICYAVGVSAGAITEFLLLSPHSPGSTKKSLQAARFH